MDDYMRLIFGVFGLGNSSNFLSVIKQTPPACVSEHYGKSRGQVDTRLMKIHVQIYSSFIARNAFL